MRKLQASETSGAGRPMDRREFTMADPRRRRAVVVLTNSANGPKVYERILTSLTGSDHPAFLWFQV